VRTFSQLTTSDLVDMLAHHTARYVNILSEGGSVEEFEACKLIIRFLQIEIEARKNQEESSSGSDFLKEEP
jgi:hypothetical protein